MGVGVLMAKKQPDRPRSTILGVRCSIDWRDWLDELAEFARLNKVDVIDQAVVEYAKRVGFKKPAPKR